MFCNRKWRVVVLLRLLLVEFVRGFGGGGVSCQKHGGREGVFH